MGELRFELEEWKQRNHFINEQKSYWDRRGQSCQWDYLFDREDTFKDYDPDSSRYVWDNVYKKIYAGKKDEWAFEEIFDFQHLRLEGCRLVAPAQKSESWDNMVRLGGETDFNFKKGCLSKQNQKYERYKELIERENAFSEEEKEAYLCKLDWCERRTHSLENFSVMLIPGAMNNCKGRGRDRIDKFIYLLNLFFQERNEEREKQQEDEYRKKAALAKNGDEECREACKNWIHISSAAGGKEEYKEKCRRVLYQYLALFDDVYDYCAKVYKMEKDLTEELIASGKKVDFSNGNDVVHYMNLAERYWQRKHELIFPDKKTDAE
ncbi:MAG: hypothetical protein K2P23_08510 [Lachnospiraceae bacterium]|nr:hypothetical protein [Lachnospiraceae bacterium]